MANAEHNLSAEWPIVSPVENSATAGNYNNSRKDCNKVVRAGNSRMNRAGLIQKGPMFFLFLYKNICCRYSLEAPQSGATN